MCAVGVRAGTGLYRVTPQRIELVSYNELRKEIPDDQSATPFDGTLGKPTNLRNPCGLSLGASVGTWLAAKYPDKVLSLSLHSAWSKTDAFLRAVVESWRLMANAVGVPETIVRGIFPWCFTPELYAARPDLIDGLSAFVRSRPAQALSDFMLQSDAVLAHDVEAQLARITAPTQITLGRHDQLTSTRFADRLTSGIRHSELVIFENSAHAPIYDSVEEFNQKTLAFLQRCARGARV